ncbi:hypothetical protein [Empedobacter tilapiae]
MKTIKQLSSLAFIGLLGLTTFSCLDDDNQDHTTKYLETMLVDIKQDSIKPVGEITKLNITYRHNNTCETFQGFANVGINYDTIYIAAIAKETLSNDCKSSTSTKTDVLEITPKKEGDFYLKFWTGTDSNGKNVFKIEKKLTFKNKVQ